MRVGRHIVTKVFRPQTCEVEWACEAKRSSEKAVTYVYEEPDGYCYTRVGNLTLCHGGELVQLSP